MPYFRDEWKYAKYVVKSTFLFTDGLKFVIVKQSLLNFFDKVSTWRSQFKFWFNQTPQNLVSDA
jgi:hypothetical protein